MGCGSSGHVVTPEDSHRAANGKEKKPNGSNANGANGKNGHHHNDDLPTVVLPETPAKPRPPIAYEIPIEEFDNSPKATTPPPHLQRLLNPPAAEIKLPDIKEKLAEAEQRRLQILQQRAASAQKRAQRMTKSYSETANAENDFMGADENKHGPLGPAVLTISPEPGVCEDKNI